MRPRRNLVEHAVQKGDVCLEVGMITSETDLQVQRHPHYGRFTKGIPDDHKVESVETYVPKGVLR